LRNRGSRIFSFLHSVQTNFVAHLAFYTIDTSPGSKTDFPPTHAEVMNARSYTANFAYAFMARHSNRRRDNFTCTLLHCASVVGMVESRFTWRSLWLSVV
jgi:hypothetical protein